MSEMVLSTHTFELSGNHVSLDFVNTLDDRPDPVPAEFLNNYSDLVAWSQQTGILTDAEARQLLEEAERQPGEAATVLERAITLRETLFRIFSQVVKGEAPEEADWHSFNAALSEAMSRAYVVMRDGGFAWEWRDRGHALDCMLWAVLRASADLLTSQHLHDIRICASESCTWMFLDTSKNHSRRWCDMKTCGNRAKVNRHYERKKQEAK